MTLEQIQALEAKARNCRDNAKAELAVRDLFNDEFELGLSSNASANAETHKRMIELYDFVIGGQNRAKSFTEDAVVFEAAAKLARQWIEA